MNGYERYRAVLNGQRPDILPRLPILMGFAAKFIDSYYGAFASDYRVLAEANRRCVEAFDFDQVSAISDPYRETQGFGAEIEFVRDGVPKCLEAPLEDSADLEFLEKPDPLGSARMLDRIRGIEEMRKFASGRYSILGWVEGPVAEAADLRGVTNFLMDLVMEPGFAGDLMDRCVEVGIEFAQAQIKAGADTIGVGDAIASQVSADLYGEMIFAREQRLFDGIHEAGGLIRLHICGNTTHLLPHFAQLHVDIIDLDWQVDMAKARAILGPTRTLVGNLDPVNAVMRSTPERIQNDVLRIYRAVGNPYMVGAGCEIPVGTPTENLRALCAPIPFVG
jgi:MtaA/CmuA family methyltransferase